MASAKPKFDCSKCVPSYCCSYDEIAVDAEDIAKLAKHLGITPLQCKKRHTKPTYDGKRRCLKHKPNDVHRTICKFYVDGKCSVYAGRPYVCGAYPGGRTCSFYDFLMAEREAQNDPNMALGVRHMFNTADFSHLKKGKKKAAKRSVAERR